MDKVVRVSEVFREAGIKSMNIPIITDKIFQTSCPVCNETQLLIDSKPYLKANETFYDCKNGCQVILVIGAPGEVAIEGRGYRLKNHVVRNVSDLYVLVDGAPKVLIPKSPAALD